MKYAKGVFKQLNRESMLKAYELQGTDLFYKISVDEDGNESRGKFNPARLATYFKVVHHAKCLGDINNGVFRGDVFTYNYSKEIYQSKGEYFLAEEISRMWSDDAPEVKNHKVFYHLHTISRVFMDDLKLNLRLIPANNGIIKINKDLTRQLIPNGPEHFVVSRSPVDYLPNATCPTWMKFITDALRPEDILPLQEAAGYGFWREIFIALAFFFVGDSQTGKSTLFKVLQGVYGDDATTALTLVQLTDKFSGVQLWNKAVNIRSDLSKEDIKDMSFFKQLVAGDRMYFDRKYKDGVEIDPYAKHFMSANATARVYNADTAFWIRWRIFRMDGEQYLADNPKRDPKLINKLLVELPGILNWSLDGLTRLLKTQEFSNPQNAETVRRIWNLWSDPAGKFLDSPMVVFGYDAWVSKDDLYEAYELFCIANKLGSPMEKTNFGRFISRRYKGIIEHDYKRFGDKQVYGWKGVTLAPTPPPENGGMSDYG